MSERRSVPCRSRIRYDGCTCAVAADEFVSEIFTNLIGNAAKFGGHETEIGTLVEDSGPGISDAMKAKFSRRFCRGEGLKSGKGFGLYMSRLLVGATAGAS